MITRRDIRQQNAERRLSHSRWANDVDPSISDGWMLALGAAAALLVVWFMAVRP